MHESWRLLLADQRGLLEAIERELPDQVLPPRELVMAAFSQPASTAKVVVVGQDPYPTPGDAIGLAFAIGPGRKLPRSLRNIMLELKSDADENPQDFSTVPSLDGVLSQWQQQGVMLLNRDLTLPGNPLWRQLTETVIERLNQATEGKLILVLWGANAQQLAKLVAPERAILSAHPSPLSANRGFFGSNPFSRVNRILMADGQSKIDWSC